MYNVFWNGFSGEALPEGIVEPTVRQRLVDWTAAGKPDVSVVVGQADLFTMYRVAIARGLIGIDEIQFWFGGELLELTADLAFVNWPGGVSSSHNNRMIELMQYRAQTLD